MLKRILALMKKQKKQLVFIVIISSILPILSNIMPEITKQVLNEIVTDKRTQMIGICTLLLILCYTMKSCFTILVQNKVNRLNLSIITELKKQVTMQVINMPLSFHDNKSSQYILNRINEVDNFSKLFSVDIITFFINIISAVVAFIMICRRNLILAVICLILVPVFALISNIFFKNMNKQIIESMDASAKSNVALYSTLDGTSTLKQFNDENSILKKVNAEMDNIAKKLLIQNATINRSGNLITLLTYIIQTCLLGAVAVLIIKGDLQVGEYASMGQYFGLVYAPVLSLQVINMNIRPAVVALKRVDTLIENEEENSAHTIGRIEHIQISGLEFSYDSSKKVLDQINIDIEAGDKVLITGGNGSGKTTLTKLLLGFYHNYTGSIQYNGKEVRSLSEKSLRDRIAMISQKNYLFNATVKENIYLANRDMSQEKFDERIEYYSRKGLFEGIELNEVIVDNGKTLSGGQIQRISLARLLIRDADVYIFDEFTNSLDKKTREYIKALLKTEFQDKITIFIAHDDYLNDIVTKSYVIKSAD